MHWQLMAGVAVLEELLMGLALCWSELSRRKSREKGHLERMKGNFVERAFWDLPSAQQCR